MPLHTPTVLAPRRPRLGLIAALASACLAAGAATIVIGDDQPAPTIHAAEPRQPTVSRFFDIEANKVASMRALGRHNVEQGANRAPRYQDIEANKARSQRMR